TVFETSNGVLRLLGPTMASDAMVDSFFELLTDLPNLHSLSCYNIEFTGSRLRVLKQLKMLSSLTLSFCPLNISQTEAPSLHLKHLKIEYHDRGCPWHVLSHPEHLEHLNLHQAIDTHERTLPFQLRMMRELRILFIKLN